MGFRSLQHTRDRRSTNAGFACPLRSALRVWLPSRRFTPSEPWPALFHAGGARGIHPSELPPLGRYPPRFRGRRTHVPFHPSVFPPPKRWAGPTGRGSWALTLPGVPGGGRGLTRLPLAAPLGFHPPRVLPRRPCPGFRPWLLPRASQTRSQGPDPPAPRSISQSSPGLVHVSRQAEPPDEATLTGFSHRYDP
jgi:hypothetical protein